MAPHREPLRSGTTTPPPEDMGALVEDELVVGEQYWMQDEKGDEVWTLAEVLEQCTGHVSIKLLDSGERKEIDQDLEEMFPKNPNVVADMTALHHIHEPGILHNLKERSRPWRQTPYTFMGTILLAVNPLKAVPTPLVEDFKDQSLDPEIPHPYAIAELSYNQMRMAGGRAGTNQSIVVSGESGAGKTETVKIILGYLARRTAGTDENLEERVLESSPILESFGNAKTLRNDNSSRFGKFLKLRFTSGESSYLDGASVEPYLLEKSRVLAQGEGERNFHILYEMIAGATQCGLAEELKLESASDYRILSSSGCITLEGIDDADRFKAIQDAFSVVGVEKDAQMQVWQALSGVLHLSTLSFHETDHQEGPVAAISDKAALSTTASLLGVSEQALEDMLTVKVVPVTRGEVFTKRLAVKEAVRARDAAIKSLYEALFLWVVRAINLSLGGAKVAGDDKLPFIGLLDIFGFENFGTKNNLEQLLINYANESLQGDFNKQVFENELRVYAEEGIDVTVSAAVYTSSCLRMLTGKRDGVLPVLDDVCSQPLPTDKRYLERLHVAFTRRRGEGMDVTVKSGGRDAMSRSTRSSAGSDDGTMSVVSNRKWGGSELGGTGSSTWTSDSSDVKSLEFVGKRGSFIGGNDIMRTEQHESFWVNHYASKVLYTVEGWVERNMDSVPQSFSDTMLSSQHAVVFDAAMAYNSCSTGMVEKEKKNTIGSINNAAIPRKPAGRQQTGTLLTRRTVAGNFMASMQDLSTTLAATTCGFVRCIKPNAAMDFGIFDSHYVVEQLRCLGVLRTCEVLKVGMPTRVSYADLKKSLGDGIMEAERMFEGQPEKSLVAAILWAFDVPSEAFRLGAKRVFFRSGQIAVLHKILNETPPDKLPWVLSRLRLALANRRLATVAAEEAEDSLAEAEAAVMEAEAVSSNTVRPINSQNRVQSPLSPGASADEDMRALVATVDKARRAAQNAVQVKTVLKAAAAEGVGENAIGASDKIQEAADAALADIAKAAERANELERLTNVGVTGADGSAGETSAARELHAALRDVRDGLINAQKLWRGAEEAADKCQADGAVAKSKEAKEKAALVVQKAKSVAETSKHAIEVARRQRKCKEATTRATEKALRTFRLLQVVARQATLEEKRARENIPAVEFKKKSALSGQTAPTPGRGLVSAAKAALANAVKYEDLSEDQKQQRAKEQKLASAEAAEAIAEAAKEEEQKRLELAALEKERMLELEEEAAAAAAGDPGHANLVEVAKALEGMGAAKSPPAGGVSTGVEPGGGGDGVAAAGMEGGSAGQRGMDSESLRDESGNPAFDAGYAASTAGKAGVHAIDGSVSGRAGEQGREEDGSRRPKTSGWGENNDQAGPGSVKARYGAFPGGSGGEEERPAAGKASAGLAGAARAKGVDGDDEDGVRGGRSLPSREGSGAIKVGSGSVGKAPGAAPAAATGEISGGRVAAETTGWGENNDRNGPGSIKGRLGKFSGSGADGASASSSRSEQGSPIYGGRAFAGAGMGGDKKPSDGDDFPKSFKERLQAFSGGKKFAPSGPRSVSGGSVGGGQGSRSPAFKRGDSWRSGEIPASGGARSPPFGRGSSGGNAGSADSTSGTRSPPYPGSGGSASSSTRSLSRSSPPAGGVGGGSLRRKGSSRREDALLALAEAKAAAAREEEEWARKMKLAEEERRKAREERKKDAEEAAAIVRQEDQRNGGGGSGDDGAGGRSSGRPGDDSEDDGGSDGGGGASSSSSLMDVRAHAQRMDKGGKTRGSFKGGGDGVRDAASAVAGREGGAVPPLSRMGSGGGGKKRSIRKSGYPYGGGADGGGGAAATGGQGRSGSREYGSGSSREGSRDGSKDGEDGEGEEGGGGEGEDGPGGITTKIRPWPEAAIDGVEDEDGEGMEAKKPLNGWQHSSAGMVPWRSPERAPEYGGSGPAKKEFVRRASFTGDPLQSRNAPWERGDQPRTITRNLSLSENMGEEESGVSWTANAKDGQDGEGGADGALDVTVKAGSGAVLLESMLFKDDAKEIGVVELKVMNYNMSEDKQGKPPRRAPTWTQYYFRLKSEVLTKSPPRRSSFLGGGGKSEEMKLSSSTVTSYTNTKNCFCVRTNNVSWFLLARSLEDMKRWMSAINKETRLIFQREHGVHDDYMGQGRRGRFFYRMVEGSTPQWILTHPMAKAPRAGDGLFPGEVIEVTQVLSSGSLTFLRLANNRGWTYARSPTNGDVLFEDLAGGVSEDTEEYSFPSGAKGIVPILHGPGLRTQATGVTIRPGERVRAAERFTPVDNTRVVFVKLEDERGWIPVKTDVRGPATVLQGW